LIRKAAIKMAGAIRGPHNKMAAMAKPVGGQMGVALGLIDARCRPRPASAKYAIPTRIRRTASDPSGWARGGSRPLRRKLVGSAS
jgi:hypothetical protein